MTAARLKILSGAGATLQDAGRHGYMRYGVTPAGPMDPLAFATANRALGNDLDATAVEVSVGGLSVVTEGPLDVAIAGGGFRIEHDGRALPSNVALTLKPDSLLTLKAGADGAWGYLAVGGGIDVAPTLGSAATHTRSGFGGLDGRALRAGDALVVDAARATLGEPAAMTVPWLDRRPDRIRVVLGPQADAFVPDEIEAFLNEGWTVTARGDRMACFLKGRPLRHAAGHDIVSDGIAMGAIQVPGDGLPIVLMADRQPTGGYPKIATVIGADIGRLAQAQAGVMMRFAAVSIEEAVNARRAERAALVPAIRLEPVVRTVFSSEFLLGLNLIDGVTA
ncbi:biotin-dependent carboxyltransferase family protein [Methylopila sp. Yamaguchi]|uniref:5-oxoprolinase subunit C family protein n=1 Tax=Methylopila sp. Yamaguchi TaxID=1437817 RepID=UPI000CB1B4F7|nr:biotin-dependent carboxyltransferase family protein [Methylopila sp. Yamaguchi]GBD49147.1 urea amidolyase related protein [Methylopila sp. Yamaguchi]